MAFTKLKMTIVLICSSEDDPMIGLKYKTLHRKHLQVNFESLSGAANTNILHIEICYKCESHVTKLLNGLEKVTAMEIEDFQIQSTGEVCFVLSPIKIQSVKRF